MRVEVSMQVAGCLSNSVQVARQVERHVLSCLQSRTISYQEFVLELECMLDLAGFLGLGTGRYTPSSILHLEFSAHLLKAVGVCTLGLGLNGKRYSNGSSPYIHVVMLKKTCSFEQFWRLQH